jgi:predicted  nucleic acid-binding Zn-ribbon protein
MKQSLSTEIPEKVLEMLRRTVRCRPQVEEAAAALAHLSPSDYETYIRSLVDEADDKALSTLLLVSAVNGVKLDPHLLAEALKIAYDLRDACSPFIHADAEAIAPLLGVAEAEDTSWERQAAAAKLATELTLTYKCDRSPVERVLRKLVREIRSTEAEMLVFATVALMEADEEDHDRFLWLTRLDPLGSLPEERPPVVIGGDYSVRRPIPKIGRNDPCHCGSGKKYKKCCYEKDQDLLRDASPYAGVTMTQAKASPALVDDETLIYNLRPYELRKLDPTALKDRQLLAACRQAQTYGLYELAFSMLLELRDRPGMETFAKAHMVDLFRYAIKAKQVEVARKVLEQIPDEMLELDDSLRWSLDLYEHPERLAALEDRCRRGICSEEDEEPNDELIALSHDLEPIFPALSIVVARAAIVGQPDRHFDNEVLLDVIGDARMALDLVPEGDPIEEFFDWTMEKFESSLDESERSLEVDRLRREVLEARQLAAQKVRELQQREAELDALMKQLTEAEKEADQSEQEPEEADKIPKEVAETIDHLRRRVKNLKEEIKAQQQARAALRRELEEAQQKTEAKQQPVERVPESSQPAPAMQPEDMPKQVLVPEFSDAFRRHAEGLPGSVVAKALRMAVGFAASDRQVWRQTRSIEGLPEHYRIRVGLHHRMLVHWQPGVRLQILDLIQRENLETWLRQYSG